MNGNERYAKGDIDGAIADFAIAIMTDPQFAMAYNNRGIARERRGDTDGAIADYTKAIEINPRLSEAYANRCQALLAQRDLRGAITDCDEAIKLNPRLAQAYNSRGSVGSRRATRMARSPITATLSRSIGSLPKHIVIGARCAALVPTWMAHSTITTTA